jgi:hypothetical protein
LTYLCSLSVTTSKFRFSRLYTGELKYEIVAIGNSRAVNSFHAPYIKEEFGYSSFNLAYNGLTPELTLLISEDYLDFNDSPQKIFIEISNYFSGEDKITNQFNLYAQYSARIDSLVNSTVESRIINEVFTLYAFNNQLWLRNLFYTNKTDQFWISNYQINEELVNSIEGIDPFKVSVAQKDLDYMSKFLDTCKKKNIEVILYLAPYYPSYRDKMINLDTTLHFMSKELNSEIMDLSNFLSGREFFSDRLHTNVNGAKSLSNALLDQSLQQREREH